MRPAQTPPGYAAVPPGYYGPPPQMPMQYPYGPQPWPQADSSNAVYVVTPAQQAGRYVAPVVYLPSQPVGGPSQQRDWLMKHESDEFVAPGFRDSTVRRNFVKKVYLLLFSQLCLTSLLVGMCMVRPEICRWIRRNPLIIYLSYGVFFCIYITLACCGNVRRSFPGNMIALFLFTLAMSYLAAAITCAYSTVSVLITVTITAASCLAISLLAIFGCIDFTKCMNLLFVLSIGFILFGISCMIIYMIYGQNKILHAIYGGVAGVLFTLYLAFDTQMIIGGRTYEMSPEEYIFATIQLYMDIMNLFIILLGFFGQRE